jgi:hypothetical protein
VIGRAAPIVGGVSGRVAPAGHASQQPRISSPVSGWRLRSSPQYPS